MKHVQTISKSRDGAVHVVLVDNKTDPAQTDLFADYGQVWLGHIKGVLSYMPDKFWFSELRQETSLEPPDSSWWGSKVPALLRRSGWKCTNQVRPFPSYVRASRRGGTDRLWEKVAVR